MFDFIPFYEYVFIGAVFWKEHICRLFFTQTKIVKTYSQYVRQAAVWTANVPLLQGHLHLFLS